MSATMARQGGQVQLEQSDMRLALKMAKMAKEGFSHAAIEETKYLIKKPHATVREEKMRRVEFPVHKKVKAATQIHPAMLCQNHTSSCLPCQNGTARNLQTPWRCKGTGAPPPDQCKQWTPEPAPPLPRTPLAPTGNSSGAQCSQMINLPAGYTYSHTALPCAGFCYHDEDTQHDTDFDSDILTDKGNPLVSTLSVVW